ncbi:MAG: MmgE/PrpD family protein [Gammaproteobacteria bacterium]|nr:MmgE/PrpD family protein [Gammaproteobacteria bacterium]
MKISDSPHFIAEQLAAFVASISIEKIPAAVVEEAKRCMLDTAGVIIAGQSTEVAQNTRVHAKSAYGSGRAHVAGTVEVMHPMGVALVNGTAGHANDFDDTSYTGIMHGSVVVFPAALALAEEQGVGGVQLLEAFIAGVEIEYAIAELCTDSIYFKGWWTSGVYGTFGAAAACAKILGLDQSAITNAISMASTYTSGMKAFFGSDAKPLGIGMSASKGMECALLAASGMTGPANAFEHESGFLKLLNDNKHCPHFDLQLSKKWRLVDPGILFKSYPVCSAAQAGAELTQRLMKQHDIAADDIQKVICEVPPLVDISLVYHQPESTRQAQFSMPFAVGCMLAFDNLGLEHLVDEVLTNPELQRQMQKVTMHVPEYLAKDPTVLQRCPEGAGVTLIMSNQQEYKDFLERPTGMPGNPISTDDLLSKFINCATYGGLSESTAGFISSRIFSLEQEIDIHGLLST